MIDFQLRTPLYNHQSAAVEKLARFKVGGLFMDMGTGKTLTAFAWIQRKSSKMSRVIWCCPASLMDMARSEILKHTDCTPDDICVVGSRVNEHNLPTQPWVIVSLEGIGSSARVACSMYELVDANTCIVIDESGYIKGWRAKRTQRCIALGEKCRYRLILTGTPISQGIEDLFPQLYFLSWKILGYQSWHTFTRKHLVYDQRYRGRIANRVGIEKVTEAVAPYTYQVQKSECLDLPQKTYSWRLGDMTAAQKKAYAEVKTLFFEELGDAPEDSNIAVYKLFARLQSVACGRYPVPLGHGLMESNRTEMLMQTVRYVPDDMHHIIWAHYQDNVQEIYDALVAEGRHAVMLTGKSTPAQRVNLLDKWRQDGGALIATLGAGGHGLTLTEAHTVFFFSNSFKYSERIQAEDRCHRIGQTKNVHYMDIWLDCGVEDRIRDALSRKGDAVSMFRAKLAKLRDKKGIKQLVKEL